MISKEDCLYIGNALMWFVICWTPIILYVKYYTRNLNQTMEKDRLKLGIKKYGYDSEFIREYNSLMLQLKYDEREKFFDKWKIDKMSTGK